MPTLHLSVFRPSILPRDEYPSGHSHVVEPPSGYNPFRPVVLRQFYRTGHDSSRGVSAPSTHQLERVHSTPACHAEYVPSSGFLTLLTAYSSPERPALFHAGNVHGVSLFRGFPPPLSSNDSSSQNCTLAVCSPTHLTASRGVHRDENIALGKPIVDSSAFLQRWIRIADEILLTERRPIPS